MVDIIDSSNLERNLYLAVQLMELNAPLVLVFNMADITRKRGEKIDIELLSELFGTPVIETVGSKGKGSKEVLESVIDVLNGKKRKRVEIKYGEEVENEIIRIKSVLKKEKIPAFKFDTRWTIVKLLEQDKEVIDTTKKITGAKYWKIEEEITNSIKHITSILRNTPEVIIAEARYGFISGALLEAYQEADTVKMDVSGKVDRVTQPTSH